MSVDPQIRGIWTDPGLLVGWVSLCGKAPPPPPEHDPPIPPLIGFPLALENREKFLQSKNFKILPESRIFGPIREKVFQKTFKNILTTKTGFYYHIFVNIALYMGQNVRHH